MTVSNENDDYHITIEWRSEASSSEEEPPPQQPTRSSQLGAEDSPSSSTSLDPAMAESGATLQRREQTQPSSSLELPTSSGSTSEVSTPQNEKKPREYQLELFRRACKENIIAFLDTGAGKTLVAALLVRKILKDLKDAEKAATTEMSNRQSHSPQVDSNASTDVEMTNDEAPEAAVVKDQLAQKCPYDKAHDQLMVFTTKPLPKRTRKIAVFLVHRVPLVPQQADVVQAVLPSEDLVGAYYGEKGVDDWSSSRWARSLRSKSVLVMTAQIFLNLLRHGLIDIRDVALLVIDEVHHATKSHPYRLIFIEFYHTIKQGEARPRIFGMTATPVKRKSCYNDEILYLTALAELEATLDATVVVVSSEGQSEIETLVPKPEEFVVTYKSDEPDSVMEEYGEEDLQREDDIISKLAEFLPRTPEERKAADNNDNAMTDNAPSAEKEEEGADNESHAGSETDVAINDGLPRDKMEYVKRVSLKLGYKAATDLATQLCHLEDISPDSALKTLFAGYSDEELVNKGISERVSKLLDIVCSEFLRTKNEREESDDSMQGRDHFQCIIFVQERLSALCLTWIINSVFSPLNCSELTAKSVVGAQNSDSCVRMSRARLNMTIDEFRRGEYGILISTSVVEEGLDIPACSLVVALDPVVSATSYIQGRGRARKKGARYIAFVQEGREDAYEGLYLARKGARIMTDVAKSGKRTEANRQVEQVKAINGLAEKDRMLFSRTTGARVSATEAVNLLHRYCYMKGDNTDWDTYKPTYSTSQCEGGFLSTVTFHASIPLDCGLSGNPQETELLAKRHAAHDAYSKLYQIGEVDEYLLPRRISRSQRVLRIRKTAYDLGIRAFTQRSKQRSRREVASKASKKNKRVRNCIVMHPQVLQLRREVEEGSTSDAAMEANNEAETLYLYKISLTCDMRGQGWYPSRRHEVFGILVRQEILERDLNVIRCPQGDPLFTLTFLREVSLNAYLHDIVNKYVRFLQLCIRGRTPGSAAALEIEKMEYEKCSKPGFFLIPLLSGSRSPCFDVDWEDMKKLLTFGWRCGPREEHESFGNKNLEYAILCSYHESLDRVYLSGSLRPDITADLHPRGFLNSSYTSFAHYYQKKHGLDLNDPTQALLEGFSVREAITNLSVSAFMLPQETCRIVPVSPLACFITSLLPMWQTFLALRTCWRRSSMEENPVDFLTFARALQPNINNVAKKEADLSYERLEFLGDAVLKVIYSMVTFVKNPDDNEGLLSDVRDLEVSNQRLADLALEMQLQNCVAFSGVSQKVKSWPWYWATHRDKNISISEKVLADCVEALIGAQFIHGGIPLATLFMDRHNLLPGASEILGIKHSNGDRSAPDGVFVNVPPMGARDKRHESNAIGEVERIIGYTFRNKRHLVVALTHGSFENGLISSYQRYEYLGDAIVGFILLSYYFQKYPDLSPGELTSLRGPALSNDLFARVIVSCGMHRKFWHNCPPLQREVNKFAELFANEESDDEDVSKTITVPKVLGDLLESIVGAIVVDKGMRLDGVEDILLRMMQEELSRFANPDKFKQNPVSELVRLIQQKCRARPNYKYLESSSDSEKICVILVDDRELGRGAGPTRRVAKRKASAAALRSLRFDSGSTKGCASSNYVPLGAPADGNNLGLMNQTSLVGN